MEKKDEKYQQKSVAGNAVLQFKKKIKKSE